MNFLAIDPLSTFGMPPVELVHLAADLGCEQVGMTMFSRQLWIPPLYPPFDIRNDPQLPAKIAAALRERDLSISFLDGFLIEPGSDISERAGELAVMAELGAPLVNTVSVDPDVNRTVDQFGVLVDMASSVGMDTTLELVPGLTIPTLSSALSAIEAVGRRQFRLLIDAMHYGRSGAVAADVAALDPHLVGYVQISDVLRVADDTNYFRESIEERLVPGTGELDNLALLAAIPEDVSIGIEVPMRTAALRGISAHDRLAPCVTATRSLLAEAGRWNSAADGLEASTNPHLRGKDTT